MVSDALKKQLGDWTCLYPFFESSEWTNIKLQLKQDISSLTPEVEVWFRAFKETKFEELSVVWLGMSPYYTIDSYTLNPTADGLAFSTDPRHTVPPSLFKLYKGMEEDLWRGMNLVMERSNKLDFLAHQGVLLLNCALTTPVGDSKKHIPVWKPFISYVIKTLNAKKEGLIFAGFGSYANELLKKVDATKHVVEEREHPAASSYEYRNWIHDNLFSKINEHLAKQNKTILWDKYLLAGEPPF